MMRRLVSVMVLCITAIWVDPVGADEHVKSVLDSASAAYKRGDYDTAFILWRSLAERGNAKAQAGLAAMYSLGKGLPKNYSEARKWSGLAADQGVASAQTLLGVLYAEGLGVPQDYATAVKWYRKAADQGDAKAQNNLGAMYLNGLGVRRDLVQAHMWFNLAAANFPISESDWESRLSPTTRFLLGPPPPTERDIAASNRDQVARMMSSAQIAEAQKLAKEWKPKK